jgi:HK97 family phage major capsid protein
MSMIHTMGVDGAQNRLEQLAAEIAKVPYSKSLTAAQKSRRLDELITQADQIDSALASYRKSIKIRGASEMGSNGEPTPTPEGMLRPGREVNPLGFSHADLKSCYEAMSRQQPYAIRAKSGGFTSDAQVKTPGTFSSPVSALPPELWPTVVHPEHESRILDRLPATQIGAPSIEFIQHVSSTGTPLVVAEGATKPEISFVTQKIVLPALKIACHIAITWESITDTAGNGGLQDWYGYVQGEVMREVMDYENAQLLTGAGGTTALQGFFNVPGILTHNAASDTGTGITALDSFEISIAHMRTGAALAEPNLVIMHPYTWSNLRRLKDAYYRFLVAPDPTQDETKTLWGLDVLTTIACPQGQALLIDLNKFGYAVIREGLTMRVGYDSGDFTANMQRIVVEERLNMAVVRPTAILALANLPYTGGS